MGDDEEPNTSATKEDEISDSLPEPPPLKAPPPPSSSGLPPLPTPPPPPSLEAAPPTVSCNGVGVAGGRRASFLGRRISITTTTPNSLPMSTSEETTRKSNLSTASKDLLPDLNKKRRSSKMNFGAMMFSSNAAPLESEHPKSHGEEDDHFGTNQDATHGGTRFSVTSVFSQLTSRSTRTDSQHSTRSRSVSYVPRVFTEEEKHWKSKITVNHHTVYYENDLTHQIQLEKPDFLKTQEEWDMEESGESFTWVPHPTLVWQAGKIVKTTTSGEVTVRPLLTPKLVVIPPNRMYRKENGKDVLVPLWKLKEAFLEHAQQADDLVALEDPNEAMILFLLRERFLVAKQIYTWVGASRSVLISLNPFCDQPGLYDEDMLHLQQQETGGEVPVIPHVFGLCKGALERCLFDHTNCSILISGESGAGKTEATKHCLRFIGHGEGSTNDGMEEKLLHANLLLEEFGNAKTNRNSNSSRFGKWIQVSFDMKTRSICNTVLTTFLLERSRVIFQAKGEASFHVFNLVLGNEDLCTEHGLGTIMDWRYMSNHHSSTAATAVSEGDRKTDFAHLLAKLTENGVDSHEQESMFQLVSSILHLGQIDFEPTSSSAHMQLKISEKTRTRTEHRGGKSLFSSSTSHHHESSSGGAGGHVHFQHVCRLLGLEPSSLEQALCFRSVEVRGERSTISLTLNDARNSVDSLAMQLYGRLFDFLVSKINTTLSMRTKPKKTAFIGLLDIFGFEIFDKNSFEQLCINFANERLQQEFNNSMFKEEEGLYIFEEIPFSKIPFTDNVSMLQLIDGKPKGLFSILDDEVKVNGTDLKFVSRFHTQHADNPCLFQDKKKKLDHQLHFQLVHYAGLVKYDALGFVQANVETFRVELGQILSTSQKPLIQSLFPLLASESSSSSSTEVGKRSKVNKQSVSFQFRAQLNDLIQLIHDTESRFIRCIKPNSTSTPGVVDSPLVMEQLRYGGVFEAVNIRRLGFPFRKTHIQFVCSFQCIFPLKTYVRSREDDYSGRCEEILSLIKGMIVGGNIHIGKTRVLYRTPQHHLLYLLRNLALETRILPWLQARLRGFVCRQTRRLAMEADDILLSSLENDDDVSQLEDALKEAHELLGPSIPVLFPSLRLSNQSKLEAKIRALQVWEKFEERMIELLEVDPRETLEMFFDLQQLLGEIDQFPREGIELSRRQDRLLDELRSRVENCDMQQKETRFAEIQDQARKALAELDRHKMKTLQTSFAQDKAIYQPNVQVFVDIETMLTRMDDAETSLELSCTSLDRILMQEKVLAAAKLKLNTSHAESLLSHSEYDFAKLELEYAKQVGDSARRIHREIFIYEQDLLQKPVKLPCAFESLPYWRSVEEWVSKAKLFTKFFRKERTMRAFKRFGDKPVHFPITQLASGDTLERRKAAVQLSKQMIFLMCGGGGKQDDDDEESLRFLLQTGLQDEVLRVELWMQLLRMFTDNPHQEHLAKGEKLLGMCLLTLPLQPPKLEEWVLTWMRIQFPPPTYSRFVHALLTAHYDREAKQTKTVNVKQLKQEWASFVISPYALPPGKCSGPTQESKVSIA